MVFAHRFNTIKDAFAYTLIDHRKGRAHIKKGPISGPQTAPLFYYGISKLLAGFPSVADKVTIGNLSTLVYGAALL